MSSISFKLSKATFVMFILFISNLFFNQAEVYSQSTGASFLEVAPSALSQSMAGAGVALVTDDAFNNYSNPGLLGLNSQETNFSFAFYPQKLDAKLTGYEYQSYAINAGLNLSKYVGMPLSVGVGFLRQDIDLGKISNVVEEFSGNMK